MEDLLILVDENDNELGVLDKLSVHEQGLLHRAFSLFVFNSDGELLIQQRANEKYHSGGLWSNTCCSHPRKGETVSYAIKRRLREEMGINCKANFEFSFIYKADFENGLTEFEYDHVYFGESNETPKPDKSEVQSWKYIGLNKLQYQIDQQPQNYSAWLKVCLPEIIKHVNKDSVEREFVSLKK